MNRLTLILMGALLSSAFVARAGPPPPASFNQGPAPANAGGFFVGGEGGVFWLQNESLHFGSIRADAEFNTGWGVSVPVGYDFGNGFSASFSAGYYHANIDSLALGSWPHHPLGVGGDVAMVPLMVNGDYKIPLGGNLYAYVGGGVGAVYNETNVDAAGGHNLGSDRSWDLGFQAFTGLSYDVSAYSSLRLGYHYTHVFRSDSDRNGHSVELGIMIRF